MKESLKKVQGEVGWHKTDYKNQADAGTQLGRHATSFSPNIQVFFVSDSRSATPYCTEML